MSEAGTSETLQVDPGALMSGAAWRALVDVMRNMERHVYGDARTNDPLLRAEGFRYLLRLLESGHFFAVEIADPDYPQLARLFNTYQQLGNMNPDCVYMYARIDGSKTYRIHGKRGSARLFEVSTMNAHMLAHPNHKELGTLTDVKTDADGRVEVVLSPEPHEGNWLRTDAEATWIYVRQYYYDWEAETPADVVIERVGATYPPPPLNIGQMAQCSSDLIRLLPGWAQSLANFVQSYYAAPANELNFVQSKSGMKGLYYGKGHFDIGPDEAAIVELEAPRCPYWSFQLMNHYWESLDFHLRQTSLNGHQAHLDPHGVFRAVIAHSDPAVPNWLDPAGHGKGLICARVLRPTTAPQTRVRVVPLKDLRDHLPPATPAVSREQRQELLRRRMLSVMRRFRE